MLVIDPDVCIDCGACIPECPVQAIYADADVPAKWKSYIGLNKDKAAGLPVLTEKKKPLKKD
jgi:ferredoxin